MRESLRFSSSRVNSDAQSNGGTPGSPRPYLVCCNRMCAEGEARGSQAIVRYASDDDDVGWLDGARARGGIRR